MDYDAALHRYLRNHDVNRWLFNSDSGRPSRDHVTEQQLSECFVYSVGIGTTQLKLPKATHIEDMLVMTHTSGSFLMGLVFGFGQPHILSQTPMMKDDQPVCRRFAVDLSNTQALEFLEFDLFKDGKTIVAFRRFLHTLDNSLPCIANVNLYDSSNIYNTLGPLRMKATLIESSSCPLCGNIGNACYCHFSSSSSSSPPSASSTNSATDPNHPPADRASNANAIQPPHAPQTQTVTNWNEFTANFQQKTQLGICRVSITTFQNRQLYEQHNQFPNLPRIGCRNTRRDDVEIQASNTTLPVVNVLQRGNSNYLNLLRRKVVNNMRLNSHIPRADNLLSLSHTNSSNPAYHDDKHSFYYPNTACAPRETHLQQEEEMQRNFNISSMVLGSDDYETGRGGIIIPNGQFELTPFTSSSVKTFENQLLQSHMQDDPTHAHNPDNLTPSPASIIPSPLHPTLHPCATVASQADAHTQLPQAQTASLACSYSAPVVSEDGPESPPTSSSCQSTDVDATEEKTTGADLNTNYGGAVNNVMRPTMSSTNQTATNHFVPHPESEQPMQTKPTQPDFLLSERTPTFDVDSICAPPVPTDPITPRTAKTHARILKDIGHIIVQSAEGSQNSDSFPSVKNEVQQEKFEPNGYHPVDINVSDKYQVFDITANMNSLPMQDFTERSGSGTSENNNHISSREPQVIRNSRSNSNNAANSDTTPMYQSPREITEHEQALRPDMQVERGLGLGLTEATVAAVSQAHVSAHRSAKISDGKVEREIKKKVARRRRTCTVNTNDEATEAKTTGAGDNDVDDKKHQCKQCLSRFKMRGDLLRHVKIVHEKKKMYSCAHCDKKFGHSGHLNRHIQSVHLQQRRFKCHICGFQFYQASHLQSHISHIHKQQRKTFRCKYCDKEFKSQNALRHHQVSCVAAVHSANSSPPSLAIGAEVDPTTNSKFNFYETKTTSLLQFLPQQMHVDVTSQIERHLDATTLRPSMQLKALPPRTA